jgi:hypothetical protein
VMLPVIPVFRLSCSIHDSVPLLLFISESRGLPRSLLLPVPVTGTPALLVSSNAVPTMALLRFHPRLLFLSHQSGNDRLLYRSASLFAVSMLPMATAALLASSSSSSVIDGHLDTIDCCFGWPQWRCPYLVVRLFLCSYHTNGFASTVGFIQSCRVPLL